MEKKKNNNLFWWILLILFIMYIGYSLALESGYYNTKVKQKAKLKNLKKI